MCDSLRRTELGEEYVSGKYYCTTNEWAMDGMMVRLKSTEVASITNKGLSSAHQREITTVWA